MTKLTTKRLETIATWRETYGNGANVMIPAEEAELMARQLLAYEQADKTTDLKTLVISEIVDFYSGFESPYEPETVDEAQRQLTVRLEKVFGLAAPVLPKQPELMSIGELLQRLEEQTGEKWVEESAQPVIPEQPEPVVLCVGHKLISKEGLELIRDGIAEATKLESACMANTILGGNYYAQPVIPEQPEFYTKPDRFLPECLKPEEISGGRRNSRIAELMGWFDRYYSGKANPKWLKAHVAELCYYILTVPQLSAQPVSEPYKLAKSPEACAWISDGEGLWLGDCGLTWTFFDNGPNENGLKYCPSCGKKVSFIAAPHRRANNAESND